MVISQKLNAFINDCIGQFDALSPQRIEILEELIQFIELRQEENMNSSGKKTIDLLFICTHNSRRSQLSQVWATVAAHYYSLNYINSFSGGTEVTALFPSIVDSLRENGLEINTSSEQNNPVYKIWYSKLADPILGFSKLFDDSFNPQSGYAAVMTCADADKNCPYIATAAQRISLPYKDPKAFDHTPQQLSKYLEKSREIATELFYVFSKI